MSQVVHAPLGSFILFHAPGIHSRYRPLFYYSLLALQAKGFLDMQTKKRVHMHSPMGWVSYPYRAATTDYLCCGQALEDSSGAGRIGLTHTLSKSLAKVRKKNNSTNNISYFLLLCMTTRTKKTLSTQAKPEERVLHVGEVSELFITFAEAKQPTGLSPLPQGKGGKSGQHRALHFLTESCLRRQSNAEENNRP